MELSDKQVKSHITNAKGFVVLVVYAPDCPFSKSMLGLVDTISLTFPALAIYRMDCFGQPAANFRFGVFGVPSVIVMNNGKEVARFKGAHSELALAQFIEEQTRTLSNPR